MFADIAGNHSAPGVIATARGPWAAAGANAGTLDAMASAPAFAIDVAIGPIFLLGIDFLSPR